MCKARNKYYDDKGALDKLVKRSNELKVVINNALAGSQPTTSTEVIL